MKIRTLIVDDEPLARERIQLLLRDDVDVEVVSVCPDGPSALALMEREAVDLMFLDIQMPEMDGFELLRSIPQDRLPAVIFTTAYDQHALKAFEAHALDYLLKPYKVERFQEAVSRAKHWISSRHTGDAMRGLLDLIGHRPTAGTYITRLPIRTAEKVLFIRTADIDSVESAGNYVVVHVGKESHVVRETLSALELQLDPDKFLRISRSAIVNLGRIKELQPMFKGDHVVVLENGRQVAMTRGLREVEKALKFSQ